MISKASVFVWSIFVVAAAAATADDVIVLVRHAEKIDESSDSALSRQGEDRARRLAAMLADAGIEAIYSTDYARTRDTARPLADLRGREIELYDADDLEELSRRLRASENRALVVGHSNTTTELVRALGGKPGPPIEPDEYDRLYILVFSQDGEPTTLLLRY